MCTLLKHIRSFNFDELCLQTFEELKRWLVTAPIVIAPDWTLPIDGQQRKDKVFHAIYYANRTLTYSHLNYTTIEKELLAAVFAFEKFRAYLVGTKVTVYMDHSDIKYLKLEIGKIQKIKQLIPCLELKQENEYGNVQRIQDDFPYEQLLVVMALLWYVDIVNFFVSGLLPPELTNQR
ncbi:Retrovirus-related Pol polyprotein from transposon 17.6 [Gossypium australe]|uniref:Retrovirus-related Pol polyprotein from transposon 17.6 n=1 Tax=Gossypium australe TaxID=47621 RepID=A0A5B6WGU0_9ROSI|nr:Retrovirus-related Pol polyprotein from transposon 17.6 [Gossypium australe]